MAKTSEDAGVTKIFKKFLLYFKNKYDLNVKIFPEKEVRKFLNITNRAQSCCDGLAKYKNNEFIKKTKSDYDLLEHKAKSLDYKKREIGFQLVETARCFKNDMMPRIGHIFIQKGGWLQKIGYEIRRDNHLYHIKGNKPVKLENGLPLYVYHYDKHNVYIK